MQTFFTRMSYHRTAEDLDDARLGKQRLEALQILKQITYGEGGYKHHPVNFMWANHPVALVIYGMMMCMEWSMHRGYQDELFYRFHDISVDLRKAGWTYEAPEWIQDVDFIRSHRSNLVRKQDEGTVKGVDYREMWQRTPEGWPYLWPVTSPEGGYELKVSKADKARLASGERTLPKSVMERVANL